MRLLLAAVLALAAALSAGPAAADSRVALVIGNGRYAMSGMALANPVQDARTIAPVLQQLGFDTETVLDADRDAMEEAIVRFARKAREADVALFFYAGHGLQDQGRNYLMPVDARLEDETDLRRRFVRLDDVLDDLSGTRAARIIILDACRDNAAVEALRAAVPKSRSGAVSRGLAAIPKTAGMLVAFATQPNRVAADGDAGNSPFTKALAQHIATPGVELRTALTRVRIDVARATGDTQVPEVSDSLLGELYLRPAGAQVAAAPPPQPQPAAPTAPATPSRSADSSDWEKENALWNAAQGIGTAEAYSAYLQAYPKGHFAAIAQAALAARQPAVPSAPPAVATAPAGPPPGITIPQPSRPVTQMFAARQPEPLETQARLFIDRLNVDWSRDNATALARAADSYGATVFFYGSTVGREQVLAEKRKFVERWPVRDYRLRPSSVRVQCWPEAKSCSVSGLVDYSARNPADGRVTSGVASFDYELSFSGPAPQILSETGKTVQRN